MKAHPVNIQVTCGQLFYSLKTRESVATQVYYDAKLVSIPCTIIKFI